MVTGVKPIQGGGGEPGEAAVGRARRRKGRQSEDRGRVEQQELRGRLQAVGSGHMGRRRTRRDAEQPNLRQVHLMHAELFDDIGGAAQDE